MTEATTYYWRVFFRNDKMGFQKSFNIVAPNHDVAISEAVSALEEKGYDYSNFAVVTIERVAEVGT